MTTAAIYARLSRDRDGDSTGTDRQLADCRSFAASRGWEVAGEYVERDVSAYRNVPRPAFDAMLAELDAGSVDVVLAWKLDRLLRRPREFEAVWVRCEAQGANLATVRDGIDTTAPMVGKLTARIMSAFAELESESLSIRETRKHEEIAAKGRRAGGGFRPFGLLADWSAMVPDEADAIRDAAGRLTAGETSLYAIASEWNARGLRTSTGKQWSTQLLRSMLRSPRLAGAREHRGELIATGEIPPILTVDEYRAMLAAITGRSPSVPAGRFLLSGLLRCSECGETLVIRRRHKDGRRYYGCEKHPGGRACGRVHIVAEPLEEYIASEFLSALDSAEMGQAIRDREEQLAAGNELETLQADEAALRELAADHYVARIIGRDEYLAAREPLEDRVKAARSRLARRAGTSRSVDAIGEARETWAIASLEDRRALLSELIASVEVRPASRRGAPFEQERATIDWRY